MVVSAVGVDMKDAMQNIQKKLSRRLFLAHRRMFLIGESLARKGIQEHIDEMSRNPQTRLRTNVAITRGDALRYLQIDYPFERVPSEALRNILYGKELSNFQMDIKGLMVMMATPGAEAMVPIITLAPLAKGEKKATFKADGIAVFHNDRMVGSLTAKQARGVLWLRDQMKRGTVTATVPGHSGKISMDLLRVGTHYTIQLHKGHPSMVIRFQPETDVLENNTDLDLSQPQNVNLIERSFSNVVKQRIEESLDILQHRYHSDVLKFGDRIHHAFPQQWKNWSDHWDKEFSQMPVTVIVQGKIRRIGMTGPSLSRRPKEVKH
jgi:spore germination protein KC